MPAVRARVPDEIRKKLKDKIDKALDDPASSVPRTVTITGWKGPATQPTQVTVRLEDPFCKVILTKKEAKRLELKCCNSDWDLCIWDPVTGEIRCTDDN